MTGAERGGQVLRIPRSQQRLQRVVIQERKITRQHEPSDVRMLGLRGNDAGDWSEVVLRVDDFREASADRIVLLIRTNRDEGLLDMRLKQPHCPFELCAVVIAQRSLVLLHARAAATGENESVKRCGHRLKSRLPPVFSTRRTLVISMSCDSALHMS